MQRAAGSVSFACIVDEMVTVGWALGKWQRPEGRSFRIWKDVSNSIVWAVVGKSYLV